MLPAEAKNKQLSGRLRARADAALASRWSWPISKGRSSPTANGKTLYSWPITNLRNGDAGEQKGKPTCDDHKYTENAGLMSPYPGGLELPEVETRPSCTDVWPPVLAKPNAKPVGKWTILDRKDGSKQWAYDGYALYTSVLDREARATSSAAAICEARPRPVRSASQWGRRPTFLRSSPCVRSRPVTF